MYPFNVKYNVSIVDYTISIDAILLLLHMYEVLKNHYIVQR